MNFRLGRTNEDTWRHKGLRNKLVEVLKTKGIHNAEVLKAIQEVPRHFFLSTAFADIAYEDKAFDIEEGQTISQPYTVAYQTHLLKVFPYCKVLEIGTGSGYQTCVLAKLGAKIYTVERQKGLYDINEKFEYLKSFIGIKRIYGDGYKGLVNFSPFDRILVTAAASFVPNKLLEQLKVGGILVIPEGEGRVQIMKRITKLAPDEFTTECFENFSFVPMLPGKD